MNRILKIVLPLAVLGLGLGARAWLMAHAPQSRERPSAAPLPAVRIVVAALAEHRLRVEAFGELRSPLEVALAAEVGGRLLWTSPELEAGGSFAAGEELARLDPTDAMQALAAAEAERSRARAALEIERATAASARADWEAFGSGEAAPLALREPQVALAEAVLAAAEAGVAAAATALARCTVRAPFAGRCDLRLAATGAVLAPGAPIARLRGHTLEARVVLAADDLDALGLGAGLRAPLPAELETRLGPAARWSGRLTRLEPALDPRDRSLGAVIEFAAAAGGAPAGCFVRAWIEGPPIADAARLPRAARAADGRFWIVDAESRLRPAAVAVVAEDADGLYVRGFAGGERVCATLPEILVEGMPVAAPEPR